MSALPRILVTGAAGKTGAATLRALARRSDVRVRGLVRTDDARAERLRQTGAEIVAGNLDDYRVVRAAMDDVQRAYFVAAPTQRSLDHGLNFAIAARDARVEHVVVLGQWLSQPDHPSFATRRTWQTDQFMTWIPGVDHTIVNVGWFADNYMPMLGFAAQLGRFSFPLGSGIAAPVSNEDIGAVAAGVLAEPAQYVGKTLRPTGPANLSPEDITAAFARAVGRAVRYRPLSRRMFAKALRGLGLVPALMQAELPLYVHEYQRSAFAGVTDVVPAVTGRPAEDFDTIVARYALADPMARRSFANTLRAIGLFARAALAPALDPVRWRDEQDVPRRAQPTFSIDSAEWLRTHPRAFAQPSRTTTATKAAAPTLGLTA